MGINKQKIIEFSSLIINYLFPKVFSNSNEDYLTTGKVYFSKYISNVNAKKNDFFNSLFEIKEIIKSDLKSTFDGDPACISIEEALLTYPGVYAIIHYRIAHKLYLLDLKLPARIICEHAHSKTGIDIHPGATIGDHFFIDHGTGVVIGETSIIGNHVRLYHGVTLGALSLEEGQAIKGTKRHPTIKDHVIIYSNSTILGGDTIVGSYSIIGCNVVLTKSVGDYKKVFNKPNELVIKDKKLL